MLFKDNKFHWKIVYIFYRLNKHKHSKNGNSSLKSRLNRQNGCLTRSQSYKRNLFLKRLHWIHSNNKWHFKTNFTTFPPPPCVFLWPSSLHPHPSPVWDMTFKFFNHEIHLKKGQKSRAQSFWKKCHMTHSILCIIGDTAPLLPPPKSVTYYLNGPISRKFTDSTLL